MPATYQPDTAAFTSNLFGSIRSNSALSPRAKSALTSDILDQQEAIQERRMKATQQAQQLELNTVRLEGDRLALEEARRAAQVKRDAVAQAPAAMQTFESILDDPALDPKTKRARINRAAMGFANALTYSPELQAKYRFAAQAAEPEPATEDTVTPYQQRMLDRQDEQDLRQLMGDKTKALKEQKEEAEKKAKSELEFLDRLKDIEIGTEFDPNQQEPKFKSLRDRELALDIIYRYDPAAADTYIDKPDQAVYAATAQIRRKALRQNSATAAPAAPKVDDRSRFR